MKTKLIQLPDYNIIVSDEKGREGLNYNFGTNHIDNLHTNYPEYTSEWNFCRKIIASENPEHNLPSIDYNGFEEKLGIVDVENYLENFIIKYNIKNDDTKLGYTKLGYIDGFKKAQLLNDKKFSLDKIISIINTEKYGGGNVDRDEFKSRILEKIQTLQQRKEFNIEIEMEQTNNKHNSPSYAVETQYKPKITNNKIKIII